MVLISATRHRDSTVLFSGAEFVFWEGQGRECGGVALSTPTPPFLGFEF